MQHLGWSKLLFAGGPGSSKAEKVEMLMNRLPSSLHHVNVGKLLSEHFSNINIKDRSPSSKKQIDIKGQFSDWQKGWLCVVM